MNSIVAHVIVYYVQTSVGFPGGISGEEPTFQCKGPKRCRFNPWVGKIPWSRKGGISTPLFLLENPMDRGAWQAAVHGVTKSWTQLK